MAEKSISIDEEIVVLFHAALLGRTDVVQNAIAAIRGNGKHSPDVVANIISQRRAEDEATPLHIASQFGHKDVIRALLNAGAIVDVRPTKGENSGKTPYDLANDATKSTFHVYFFEQVAMGNTTSIQRLLDGGLPVDVRDGSSAEDSALHWASSFGSIEVAKVLLSNGIESNIINKLGQSALHIACKNNKLDIVKLLLDEGAEVNLQDFDGKTALQYSTSPEMIAILESPPTSPSYTLHKEYEMRQHQQQQQIIQTSSIVDDDDKVSSSAIHDLPINNRSSSSVLDSSDNVLDDSCSIETPEQDDVLLVFWPPVQRQFRPVNRQPFSINSADNLLICMSNSDIDLFPILTWTGFMDVIDSYGFQAQVKRSAKGAKIRLCLNPHVCPIREGYQISVNIDQVVITGADYTGLTYGVHTFLQLLQLHSLINKDQAGTTYIKIPAINIVDYPKIPVRSVLWSHRQYVQFQDEVSRDFVEIMSKLRINNVSLVMNPIDSREAETLEITPKSVDDDRPMISSGDGGKIDETTGPSASSKRRTFLLDELCDKHCIEIVPTIFISSMHDRLSLSNLRNFTSPVINIVFLLDETSIVKELKVMYGNIESEKDVDINLAIEACIDCCTGVLKDAQMAGFSTTYLASNKWVSIVADPYRIAGLLGIHAVESKLETLFPSSLFSKPLICTKDYVSSMNAYITKVEYNNDTQVLFPAFMDRDFHFPSVLIKYYTFMYAGFSWNRSASIDMLGDPGSNRFSTKILSDALNLILFPDRSTVSESSFKKLLHLITFDDQTLHQYITASHHADITSEEGYIRAEHVNMHEISNAEKHLWHFVGMESEDDLLEAPSRTIASYCLRLYRKILTESQWKAQDFSAKNTEVYSFMQFMGIKNVFAPVDSTSTKVDNKGFQLDSEIEELFCCYNLMSLASRASLVSYNAVQKQQQHQRVATPQQSRTQAVSYQTLLNSLAVGIKSDLANSMLEGLNSFTFIWKRRFNKALLGKLKASGLFQPKIDMQNSERLVIEDLRKVQVNIHKRYLVQIQPIIPAFAIFRVLCHGLPLPKSLEDYVDRMFT